MAETPVEIPGEYTVKLEPGSMIGGIVQDENGKPVVGAVVHVSIPVYWKSRSRQAASCARQLSDEHRRKRPLAMRHTCPLSSTESRYGLSMRTT